MAGTTEMLARPAPRPALLGARQRARRPDRAARLARRGWPSTWPSGSGEARRSGETSWSPGAPGSSARPTCATGSSTTRTTRSGCSTSSPTPAGARTSRASRDRCELVVGRHRRPRRRRGRRSRAATRSSTSPPSRTSTARSSRRASSSRPTSSAPTCCSRRRATRASATSRSRPTRSTVDRGGVVHRDVAARPLLALLGLEGRRRPDRRRLPPHLRLRGADRPGVEQLRPAPVPGEADPALHPQRARRRPAARLRRRHAGPQLALRRGLRVRDRPRARARRARRGLQRRRPRRARRTSRSCGGSSSSPAATSR